MQDMYVREVLPYLLGFVAVRGSQDVFRAAFWCLLPLFCIRVRGHTSRSDHASQTSIISPTDL